MNERQFFNEIARDASRLPAPASLFTVSCQLYSRVETALEPGRDPFDENVDAHLQCLLRAFEDPGTVSATRHVLPAFEAEAFRQLEACSDGRLKCLTCRTDSDFLVLSVGIFQHQPDPRQKRFPPSEDASIRRGKAYYRFSYSYSQLLHRGDSALAEVLEKLSVGFEKYLRILSHLRGEYFDLGAQLERGEFHFLERAVSEEARRMQLKEKEDRFLETYAEWRRTGEEELKESLRNQADAIRELKPDFKFTV